MNQLLTSLDGFEVLKNVFVIAATSRPDIIDPALLRPGRLDTHLLCDLPSVEERADVLRVACKGVELAPDVDLARVAGACEGMTYADVNALVYVTPFLHCIIVTLCQVLGAAARRYDSRCE